MAYRHPYIEVPRAKDTTCNIRCTQSEKAGWKNAAPNGNVSEWARQILNKAAGVR